MYIPEDAIDRRIVAVDKGYDGSSNDHYYRSLGVIYDASRLPYQQHACGCQPCLKLQPGCTLTQDNYLVAAQYLEPHLWFYVLLDRLQHLVILKM